MSEFSTEDLNDFLKKNEPLDIDAYALLLAGQPYHDFVSYMDYLISQKKLKRKDIFIRADISEGYGYKLLTGEAKTSDRDKLLRLFVAMQLTNEECRRALQFYGFSPLYARIKRDVIIMNALDEGRVSVDHLNERLLQAGEVGLTESQ